MRYIIDHAPMREAVILPILLESGARVSEVLRRPTSAVAESKHFPSYIGYELLQHIMSA